MSNSVHHRFVVETTATGYSAYEESTSVYTTGATLDELFAHVREALSLYYEDADRKPPFEVELVGLLAA